MANERDVREDAIGSLLALFGGFADAASFVLVGSFTGHLTGNTLLMAIYLAQGRFDLAAVSAAAVVAFVLGTTAGLAWRLEGSSGPGTAMARRLLAPLAVEAVLTAVALAAILHGGTAGHVVFVVSAAFALGIQNGTLGKLDAVSIHSTYITGLSTALLRDLLAGADGQFVRARVLALFVVGAVAGAVCAVTFGAVGFAPGLAPLAAALVAAALPRQAARRRPPTSAR